MKNKIIIKCVPILTILCLLGCIIVVPVKEKPKVETPKDCVSEEGPWYSEEFLRENPQAGADTYLCSNYYKNKQKE